MNKKGLPTAITVIAAICAAGLAAWGGYVFCTQVTIGDTTELYALIPVYIILVLLGAFFDVLVHEGAHFLVGAICSMGVKAPKIRIFKSSSVEISPKGAKGLKVRFFLTAAAGLFFDLLLAVLGIIAFAVPSVPPLLGIAMPYAFYSFVINVVPLEYRVGKTDGCQIVEIFSHSDVSKVLFTILKVQGLVNAGTPLKEIDEGLLLDVPQIAEDELYFIILTQLRYEYYLAKDEDSEAYKYFLRYKELIRYLPSEYKSGDSVSAHRAKIQRIEEEEEEQEEETVTIEQIQEQIKQAEDKQETEQPEQEEPKE